MKIAQILVALMLLVLWLWLINSWKLRNWRAVALCCLGTIAILIAGMLPYPVRGLVQAGVWGVLGWVFVIHPELVGVMLPAEYAYVDRYTQILRRIDRRKHHRDERDVRVSKIAFEADVRSLEGLTAPPAWSDVQLDTISELHRRLTMMNLVPALTYEDTRAADQRWREVGQQFRDVLKARAGFWTGWPHPRLGSGW
jgi:hypothetical protein